MPPESLPLSAIPLVVRHAVHRGVARARAALNEYPDGAEPCLRSANRGPLPRSGSHTAADQDSTDGGHDFRARG